MKPKICVSILPETISEALNLIERVERYKPDLIEIRLDCFNDQNRIGDIKNHSKTLLIATNRAKDCGGEFAGNEAQRQQTLLNAAKNGFDYVDIELSTPKLRGIVKKLRSLNVKPIVSAHDFDGTQSLAMLRTVFREETANDADVCKIITTAKRVEDNLTVLNFTSDASRSSRIVCFCMGETGKPSRLLSPVFGALFTIASFERGKETAAGQMTIQEMRATYQALGLTTE